MRIGLDCDGVLSDFQGYVIRRINQETNQCLTKRDWTDWDFSRAGIEGRAVLRRLLGEPDTWANLKPIRGAQDCMTTLWAARHELVTLTACPECGRANRLDWLWDWFSLSPDQVFFCEMDEKPFAALGLGLDWIIEDNQETAEACAEAGTRTILLARPWNHWVKKPNLWRLTWPMAVAKINGGGE